MTGFLSFNLQQAYEEIKAKAEAEGVKDNEAWDSMVEEYLNDKLSAGELHPDQNTEGFEAYLQARWNEYKKN